MNGASLHPWVAEGKGRLRFGTSLSGRGEWTKNRDLAQALEELGFDSGMVGEHPAMMPDCWTTLAAFAAVTSRLRLVSTACVYYRSPQLLAREAADVDALSGGRLVLGLGAGWAKGDFDLLGIPFPPVGERVRYLGETVKTVRALWTDPPTVTSQLSGRTITQKCNLEPAQQPYVPILIAGAGEKAILPQAAEHADMVNLEGGKAPTPDDVRRKLAVLDHWCAKYGRAPESIVRSHFENRLVLGKTQEEVAGRIGALPPPLRAFVQGVSPRELIDYYRPILDAGIDYLYFNPFGNDVPSARLFAETVMPELQGYYASIRA